MLSGLFKYTPGLKYPQSKISGADKFSERRAQRKMTRNSTSVDLAVCVEPNLVKTTFVGSSPELASINVNGDWITDLIIQ